jgi:hypothetical protein
MLVKFVRLGYKAYVACSGSIHYTPHAGSSRVICPVFSQCANPGTHTSQCVSPGTSHQSVC